MPSSGTFEKRFDLSRAIEGYTLNDRYSDLSDGTLQISAAFAHANELIVVDRANHANDKGSVIRVLRGQTPVAHFVARRVDRKWSSNFNVKPVLLDGAEFFLDRQTVPNFDYPNVPMRNPDWIYGAESVFEGPGGEIAFEQQAIFRESTVTSGVFRLNFGGNQTPDLDFNSSASEIRTALEDLASIDQVTVDGNGTPFAPWVIEFIVPEGDVAQLTISNSTLDGNMFVSTLRAGGTLDPRPWSPSFHPVTKLFHSTYTFFQMVEAPDPLYLDDTHSLAVDADTPPFSTDYGGAQVMVNVVGGGYYRAEIPIYSPTAQVVRFVIRDMNEGHIVSIEHTTAVNTWEVLEIEGIEIPIGVDQVIFRLGLITSGDPGIIYISPKYSLLAPGFKAAPLGKILGEILIFIQAQGDFLWVHKTFTDATDSKGVDWDQDLSWGVQHGQTLLQLHEYANKWNYRWGFDWSVANNRWEWHAYNPGTTLNTITNIGIVGHDGVIGSGTISTKVPEATHYQADGDGGEWGEFTDPVMPTIWGRLHKFYSNAQGMASTELTILAERLVDHASEYTEGLMVELQNPEYLPWEDYKKGDSLTVVMTPEFPVGSIPIMAIVANKEVKRDPIYNIHLNSVVYEGEAAIAENLRRLIRAFKAEQFNQARGTVDPAAFSGGGDGGTPTIFIATSDCTEQSLALATEGFVMTGTNDEAVIQEAVDVITAQLDISGGDLGGRITISEGTANITVPNGANAVNVGNRITIEGLNPDGTWIRIMNNPTSAGRFVFNMENGSQIRNLLFQSATTLSLNSTSAEAIIASGTVNGVIENCHFVDVGGQDSNLGGTICLFSASEMKIRHCYFRECQPPAIVANGNERTSISDTDIVQCLGGIRVANSESDMMVSDVYIDCADSAIYSDDTADINHISIDHCTLYPGDFYGILLHNAERVEISNTLIAFPGSDAIRLEYDTNITLDVRHRITDNIIQQPGENGIAVVCTGTGVLQSVNIEDNIIHEPFLHGIVVDQVDEYVIEGNSLKSVQRHGISAIDSSYGLINGNLIRDAGLETHNTYDGINTSGSTTRTDITNNKIESPGASPQMRYGINISGGINNYYGNRAGPSANFGTAPYNNGGTGLNTFPGAGGAQGDNFVN